MDEIALYIKLAERWQAAARQTKNDVLGACYADRAARYFALAAQSRSKEFEAPSPKAFGP